MTGRCLCSALANLRVLTRTVGQLTVPVTEQQEPMHALRHLRTVTVHGTGRYDRLCIMTIYVLT